MRSDNDEEIVVVTRTTRRNTAPSSPAVVVSKPSSQARRSSCRVVRLASDSESDSPEASRKSQLPHSPVVSALSRLAMPDSLSPLHSPNHVTAVRTSLNKHSGAAFTSHRDLLSPSQVLSSPDDLTMADQSVQKTTSKQPSRRNSRKASVIKPSIDSPSCQKSFKTRSAANSPDSRYLRSKSRFASPTVVTPKRCSFNATPTQAYAQRESTPVLEAQHSTNKKRRITDTSLESSLIGLESSRSTPDIETPLKKAKVTPSVTPETINKVRNALIKHLARLDVAAPHRLEKDIVTAENTLFDLLEKTVKNAESNSVMIAGARGSGKSMVLERALSRLNAEVAKKTNGTEYYKVYLNGLIHTNDRIALRDIVKQLKLEASLEGKMMSSFADTLSYVLSLLKSGTSSSVPIVIILDEMDLFAQHSKQTLLYNLFDIAQRNENPIAVVGFTCRLDTLELLEKRVKSRFSHRTIHLYAPRSLESFCGILEDSLELKAKDDIGDAKFVKRFNNSVKELFVDMKPVWKTIYDHSSLFKMPGDICLLLITQLTVHEPLLDQIKFASLVGMFLQDRKVQLSKGLSVLELCLLVSVKIMLQNQVAQFNFEMAYDEYQSFIKRVASMGKAGQLFYTKPVALKAFETLLELGLLKFAGGAGSKCPKEHRMVRSMLSRDQIIDSIKAYDNCPEVLSKWATSA